MKKIIFILYCVFVVDFNAQAIQIDTTKPLIQFIYTSDVHYGITRNDFRKGINVDATIVNKAMIEQLNKLPGLALPNDKGVNAGNSVGDIDYIIETGDIANRQEAGIQNATISWQQFTADYINGITIKNSNNQKPQLLLAPGNHDVSDAIGHYKIKAPEDASSMVGIYNTMLHPAILKTNESYHYQTDKINYSKDVSGMHFMFITIWPDSSERIWMEKDLVSVKATTPVIIFTHDPPDGDYKHFTNPNGNHDINETDKFENLLDEVFKDGTEDEKPVDTIEQKGFVAFLKKHRNIKAYFHGHNNWNEYYVFKGPNKDIALNVFRVDSPMKGKLSSKDETKLSFQLISIDTGSKKMTVRECLWNTEPTNKTAPISWGETITVSL